MKRVGVWHPTKSKATANDKGRKRIGNPQVGCYTRPVQKKTPPRDVNQNVHRIFGEMIERSEQPPNRGNLKKVAPPPAKKNGATK